MTMPQNGRYGVKRLSQSAYVPAAPALNLVKLFILNNFYQKTLRKSVLKYI